MGITRSRARAERLPSLRRQTVTAPSIVLPIRYNVFRFVGLMFVILDLIGENIALLSGWVLRYGKVEIEIEKGEAHAKHKEEEADIRRCV